MVTPTRDRFVDAAARLYADQGYAATSVADLQTALGLTAGSGALYKHFASKRALLDEVVDRHLRTVRSAHADFLDHVPDDLEAALGFTVDVAWAAMRRDRDILRVLLRDLEAHPDLLDRVWATVRSDMYDVFAQWLRRLDETRTVALDDPDATSAVLLASLTYRPILQSLIGHTPGDVGEVRYRRAWIRSALATLGGPSVRAGAAG